MAYCAERDSDPVVLSVPDTALDADSASANIVANVSLQVLLQQGKRQSIVIEAAGSAAVAETGTLIPYPTDLAEGGTQVEGDLDDLDNTHVTEPGRKKDGKKTTSQRKCSRAARRRRAAPSDAGCSGPDRRLAERDQHVMEQLTGLVKGVSETMEGTTSDLEKKVTKTVEGVRRKGMEKIVEPTGKEATVTQAEHWIKMAVQRDADERRRDRMDKEDRISTNTIDALRSDVVRLSAKLSEEVVCMKSRHHGSAASTVAGSTGSGGSTGNLAARVVQNTFVGFSY